MTPIGGKVSTVKVEATVVPTVNSRETSFN